MSQANKVHIDIPNPSTVGHDDNSWVNVHTANSREEAVAWIRANIGHCDDNGNICLLSVVPSDE